MIHSPPANWCVCMRTPSPRCCSSSRERRLRPRLRKYFRNRIPRGRKLSGRASRPVDEFTVVSAPPAPPRRDALALTPNVRVDRAALRTGSPRIYRAMSKRYLVSTADYCRSSNPCGSTEFVLDLLVAVTGTPMEMAFVSKTA